MIGFLGKLATASVLFTGLLYTSSVAYYRGYLLAFPVQAEILHRNVDQILYHGWSFLYPYLLGAASLCAVVSWVVYYFSYKSIKVKYQNLRNVKPMKEKILQYKFNRLRMYVSSWVLFPTILLGLLLAYLATLALFEYQGLEKGNNMRAAIQEGYIFNMQCIQPLNQVEEKKEIIVKVFCGTNVCLGSPLNSDSYFYYEAKNIVLSNFNVEDRCGFVPKLRYNKAFKTDSQRLAISG
ncbi:hypothetical protein ACRZ5S_18110 [Vibrio scophthalmi]|uniref:hypothetical protein n=1 Tax=Vibrio scophthalmi TaxID=45658 RepID=UPI003EBA1EAC